jgi:hypothetical protein
VLKGESLMSAPEYPVIPTGHDCWALCWLDFLSLYLGTSLPESLLKHVPEAVREGGAYDVVVDPPRPVIYRS